VTSSFPLPSGSSTQEFEQARHQATFGMLLTKLRGEPTELLSFEEVRQKLRLTSRAYRGVREVSLDLIIGSVGRYLDFTRTFLPLHDSLQPRWSKIAQLTADRGLGPVELYQVGESYFVLDGHHRVSVARQNNAPAIEAHVYEYATRVPLERDTTLDKLLIKEENREFLEHTGLDKSRPEQDIEFTTLGCYRELECQIALLQSALSQIDERPFSCHEAATYWYDMIYTSVVQIIQQQGILESFPGRTEADLFVWIMKHQRELSEAYGHTVPITQATDYVVDQHAGKWPRRFLSALKKRLLG